MMKERSLVFQLSRPITAVRQNKAQPKCYRDYFVHGCARIGAFKILLNANFVEHRADGHHQLWIDFEDAHMRSMITAHVPLLERDFLNREVAPFISQEIGLGG